jgi:two-component system cell cycle response regulator
MPSPPFDRKFGPEGEVSTVVGLRAIHESDTAGIGLHHPHLIVLAGENVGRTYRVEQEETVIGRAEDASIRLRDEGVSRRHARIVRVGDDVWLEDLSSANGTRVNGETVDRYPLRDSDKISIGKKTVLKFAHSDALEEGFHQAMYEAAVRDGLTRTFNKRHFLERLSTEVAYAERHGNALSLLMVDVDHFKKVNDHHGHPAGDYVLTALAQVLTAAIRTEDVLARFGGEEFSILCRGTALGQASILGQRLRVAVEAYAFEYRKERIPVTISIGVASCTIKGQGPQQLLLNADAALYDAKRSGRNRVVTHGQDATRSGK